MSKLDTTSDQELPNISLTSKSYEDNGIPKTLRDLVTQTDKNGVSLNINSEGEGAEPRPPENDIKQKKPSFMRQLFCCVLRSPYPVSKNLKNADGNGHNKNQKGFFFGSGNNGGRHHGKGVRLMPFNLSNGFYASTGNTNGTSQAVVSNSPLRPTTPGLLGPAKAEDHGKICLVLDLDETLVHSSFQPVNNADFVLPIVIDNVMHNVFVIKRPGVDEFLERVAKHFELVVYTASLSKYADPLLDELDKKRFISKRLFREHCVFHQGHFVKDLSLLNRDLKRTIIVDNSPMSYIFHPEHAIDCLSFIDDPRDNEMWKIADFLESIRGADDIRAHCTHWRTWVRSNPSTAPSN